MPVAHAPHRPQPTRSGTTQVGGEIPIRPPTLVDDQRELSAASTPFHFLYLVVRWLAPWAVALAMAMVIAHIADGLFVPSNSVEVVASDAARPMQEQTLVTLEPEGVLTPVTCPADSDKAEREVLLTTLQDLQLLKEGGCGMRS